MDRFLLIGRNGLMTSTVLSGLCENGMVPECVVLEQVDTPYPPLTQIEAEHRDVRYLISEDLNGDSGVAALIEDGQIDRVFVAGLGSILKKPLLGMCPIINVHPSCLPANKGAYPLFWMMKSGTDQYGVTLHELTEQIDAGKIYQYGQVDCSGIVDGWQLVSSVYKLAGRTLVDWMGKADRFKPVPVAQEPGSYDRKFNQEDFKLDLGRDVSYLHKTINRLRFYGPSCLEMDGEAVWTDQAEMMIQVERPIDASFQHLSPVETLLHHSTGILRLRRV